MTCRAKVVITAEIEVIKYLMRNTIQSRYLMNSTTIQPLLKMNKTK